MDSDSTYILTKNNKGTVPEEVSEIENKHFDKEEPRKKIKSITIQQEVFS